MARKELNGWCLAVRSEQPEAALSRCLIGFDELRARITPFKYPNVEISDEGYFWFNADIPIGSAEIFVFPFGFKGMKTPSLGVSLPQNSKDIHPDFLNELQAIAERVGGAKTMAGFCTRETTIGAYKQNVHPPLILSFKDHEIYEFAKQDAFFNYFGIIFPIINRTIDDIERIIRNILQKLSACAWHAR